MSYVQAFNNQWLNFLKEMSKSFPENKEIAPLRNQLLLATKADKNLPIKAFIDAELLYYKPYITAKNDKFFLELDLSKTPLAPLKLKDVWGKCSENTKKNIWLYIQVIFKICDKYLKEKEDKKKKNSYA